MKLLNAFGKWLTLFRRTPLHPQWLLGGRSIPRELKTCRGLVVDVGSAHQWFRAMLDPGARYLALDMPVRGGQAYADRPELFARAESLPLSDSTVDVVACFEVLEHVDNMERAVAEAARVLRSGGYYVISMPFMYPLHDRPRDFRRATPFGLARMLTDAGFKMQSIRRMMSAIDTVGLLAALAVAGGVQVGGWRLFLFPVAVPIVLAINLTAWLLSKFWPDWDGVTMGYEVVARKP